MCALYDQVRRTTTPAVLLTKATVPLEALTPSDAPTLRTIWLATMSHMSALYRRLSVLAEMVARNGPGSLIVKSHTVMMTSSTSTSLATKGIVSRQQAPLPTYTTVEAMKMYMVMATLTLTTLLSNTAAIFMLLTLELIPSPCPMLTTWGIIG